MAVNQVERAFRAWPILTACANQRRTVTYGQLGAALRIHHRAVRYVLGLLQDYCLGERLPPITILVVNAAGRPGAGFIAFDHDRLDEGLDQVYSYKWLELSNPFEFADTGETYETLIKGLIESPDDSDEVYRLVRSRGIKQILFRDALVKAYAKRCAFTQITFSETLEACHIVPWTQSSSSEKMDVRNGILLNSFHHKLFDRGLMTISVDYRIVYCDPREKDGEYTEFDRALTASLHGKKIHLPRLVKHRPSKELIERHHVLAGWERDEVEI